MRRRTLIAQLPVSKKKKNYRAINLALNLKKTKKQEKVADPKPFDAKIKETRAAAWALCLKTVSAEGRMGGAKKLILESATVDQTRTLRNIDQTFKNVHKKWRRNVNNA